MHENRRLSFPSITSYGFILLFSASISHKRSVSSPQETNNEPCSLSGQINSAAPVVSRLAIAPQIASLFSTSQTTIFPQSCPKLMTYRSVALKHNDCTTNLWISYRANSLRPSHCQMIILARAPILPRWPDATNAPLEGDEIREMSSPI